MEVIDQKLLRECAQDDREAQKELYTLLYAPLLRISKRYFINDEDALTAMHNAFLKIIDKLDRYHYDKSFLNWTKTILINSILDDLRRSKRKYGLLTEYREEDSEQKDRSIYNDVERIIEMDHVNEMLNILPNATRIVFNLYVFEEFTHKEIGKTLKISTGTSKWHVAQAKQLLKDMLSKNNALKPNHSKEKLGL